MATAVAPVIVLTRPTNINRSITNCTNGGYHLQAAVDAEHHFIVAHEVINEGNDRAQLAPMGGEAHAAIDAPETTVLADRGYMNGAQVLECEGTGILPCVPRTDTSGKARRGLFIKADFVYDADHDRYLPGRGTSDQGACAIGPPWRHR